MVRKYPNHEHERDDGALRSEHAKGEHLEDEVVQLGEPNLCCRVQDLSD